MMPTIRKVLAFAAVLSIILVLAGSAAWWSIHTSWFASLVRLRIVSTLQAATGARVELRGFTFNPDTLQARLSDLIIHGTEPSGAQPLLAIASGDVSLKLLSIWSHDVDVESIVIRQPQLHLTVYPNGKTNIPDRKRHSRENPIEQLLDLKVKHLQIVQGLLQINDQKSPVDLTSEDTALSLDYNYSGPSYAVVFRSEALNIVPRNTAIRPVQVAAKGQLFSDYLDIEKFNLTTDNGASTIRLSGKIQHFAHPVADADIKADLSIDELAKLGGINAQLQGGRGQANGKMHVDSDTGQFTFEGKANALRMNLVLPQFRLLNMNGSADVRANNGGILLHHAEGSARGARFSGEGSIKAYQFLQVQGNVSQVALSEVASYLTKQPFPWSGTAHGLAHASAHLTDKNPDFIIGAKVEVEPGKTGIPTSGAVDITYYNRTGIVDFGDTTLRLPNSTISFNGSLNSDLTVLAESKKPAELEPLIPIFGMRVADSDLPILAAGGSARFKGTLHNLIQQPVIEGDLQLANFKFRNYAWDSLTGQLTFASGEFTSPRFQLQESGDRIAGSASLQLRNWSFDDDSPLHLNARFLNLNLVKTAALFTPSALPFIQGFVSGNVTLNGTLNNPRGVADAEIKNLDAYGEQLNDIQLQAALAGNTLRIEKGRVQSGPALLKFSGIYEHSRSDWATGEVTLKADTNGFPLSSLSTIRKYLPAINGHTEAHLDVAGRVSSSSFEPVRINGSADFEHVSANARELGNVSLNATTSGNAIVFTYTGDLRDTKFHGDAQAQLTAGTPIRGGLQMERISIPTLKSLASETKLVLPVEGFLDGNISFDGFLQEPAGMHARASIKNFQISSRPRLSTLTGSPTPDVVLRNSEPIVVDLAAGLLSISKFEMDGRDTSIKLTGRVPLFGDRPLDLKAVGKVDLALFSMFDPNVRSSGNSELEASVTGPISAPSVTGTLQVRNGSFFLGDIANGLSDVNGNVVFSRNRATIQKMTAHSGGGDISLGGSLSFSEGTPLVYHLEADARNVRVRYANSISITSNADLRLNGSSDSSILSGTLTVNRVVFTPNADAGNLLAAASSAGTTSADQGDFISGLHLDVSIESAPSLQVSTNLSRDVEAEIGLRLRGTPDHPIVLGDITANQGDIKIFGTRFSLNRGEVSFVNTVRVEPVLDLDLETQAHGVTVDITVSGTPSKLNFNYRSDPPLQPRDIIALLTVGRTPGVGTTSNAQGTGDVGALSSGVNSVLGQAISPVSNRLSKLFGIANIRIDPFVQGITNTPQARLSVEQQISRNVTITYVTNLSQTSEQIFRFELALNRQFSVVAIRDDNGEFGIDFQYKKRFK